MNKNKLINRILIGSCALACTLPLVGCAIEVSPYTEEEIDKIGEYSALLIAGSNPDNSRLVEDEITQEEETEEEVLTEEEVEEPEEENDIEDDQNNDSAPDIDVIDVSPDNQIPEYEPTLEEFLSFASGVTITYKGYEWKDSLTNDSGSYFYDPEEGNHFLILNYTIYNGSGTTQDIDFLYAGYAFNLNINGEKTIVAHEIPINEDLPTYIGRLNDGTGVNLIITFECDSSYINNVDSLKLTIKNSENSCSTILE